MVLLVVAALTPRWPKGLYAWFTVAIALATIVVCFFLWHNIDVDGAKTLVGGAIAFDHFAIWMTITICAAIILVSLSTDSYLRREDLDGPEVYALYLLSALGGVVMASANDLIVLFLGLEILSIALYVLAASNRRRSQSQESGIKYFVLGGFSSAFFLYGVALLYGGAGSTNFTTIFDSFNAQVALDRKDGLILAGRGAADRRARVQDLVGAVPLLGTRRVPGRAHPGHRVHGVGRQGRGVRRAAARPRCRPAQLERRLSPGDLGARRADAVRRRGDGGRSRPTSSGCWPTRRSTTPGSCSSASRPRRTSPVSRRPARRCRRCCSTCCCTRCWSPARSPSSRLVSRTGDGATDLVVVPRARTPAAGAGPGAHGAAARPGRRAADVRVRRQVRRDPGGGRGEELRARRHRHAHRGDRRVPLPADHGQRVDRRSRGRRRRPRARCARRGPQSSASPCRSASRWRSASPPGG